MIAQGVPGVFGAERAALLQQRYDAVDEVVEAVRGEMRDQDETVARVGLDVQVDLVGDLCGGSDELLATGHRDHQLADAELVGFGALAPARRRRPSGRRVEPGPA